MKNPHYERRIHGYPNTARRRSSRRYSWYFSPTLARFVIPAHALGADGALRATFSIQSGFGYRIERPSPPKRTQGEK